MVELLAVFLFMGGGVFALGAGLGVWRLPDVYMRMHASTKAGTLGVGLIVLGVAVYYGEMSVVARAFATIAFLFLTAPVAGHMIGRAAYRDGVPLWAGSVVDEYERKGAAFEPLVRGTAPPAGH